MQKTVRRDCPDPSRIVNISNSLKVPLECSVRACKDVTLFWKKEDFFELHGLETIAGRAFHKWNNSKEDPPEGENFPRAIHETLGIEGIQVRACICPCFRRNFFSGTFRCDTPVAIPTNSMRKKIALSSKQLQGSLYQNSQIANHIWNQCGFANDKSVTGRSVSPCGLIVVSGSTNSAKSCVAQSLALETVFRAVKIREHDHTLRCPHLVTVEDPIEKWELDIKGMPMSLADELKGIQLALSLGFCFTPREKEKDVSDLPRAVEDALRQTPTCFFVGEVRNQKDWEALLSFAGTGHLVIATTHAETLSETIHRVLSSGKANNAVGRREIASRLLACVHLRMVPEPMREKSRLVLPSVWLRSAASVSALVSEGMSSITSNNMYVLSRYQFLRSLGLSLDRHLLKGKLKTRFERAKSVALTLDLKELQLP